MRCASMKRATVSGCHRYDWTEDELKGKINRTLTDKAMKANSRPPRGRCTGNMGNKGRPDPGRARMTATPRMNDPQQLKELKDWGRVPTMIEGEFLADVRRADFPQPRRLVGVRGVGVHAGASGTATVTKDEFCHFLSGRCTYTHELGESSKLRRIGGVLPKGVEGHLPRA